MIGLAQTPQKYHQRFLKIEIKLKLKHKFHQNVIQCFFKNQKIVANFVNF